MARSVKSVAFIAPPPFYCLLWFRDYLEIFSVGSGYFSAVSAAPDTAHDASYPSDHPTLPTDYQPMMAGCPPASSKSSSVHLLVEAVAVGGG